MSFSMCTCVHVSMHMFVCLFRWYTYVCASVYRESAGCKETWKGGTKEVRTHRDSLPTYTHRETFLYVHSCKERVSMCTCVQVVKKLEKEGPKKYVESKTSKHGAECYVNTYTCTAIHVCKLRMLLYIYV